VSDGFTLRLDPEQFEQLVAAVAARVVEQLRETNGNGESPWLSVREGAQRLGVSERTLARRIRGGKVRSTPLGRRRLLHRDDLDALAAAGEDVAPTTPPRHRTGTSGSVEKQCWPARGGNGGTGCDDERSKSRSR
jgi:excisionase family DNA binding protein